MNILVVGNVLKDVYLNLDSRTESFETDKNGTEWLDFAFNGSKHHFFSRMSSFGGAAITAEVLTKMGHDVSISASDLNLDDSGMNKPTPADSYRYILTSNENISYLTETTPLSARFEAPTEPVSYLYVDRSAHLDAATADKVQSYLDSHLDTALILYLGDDQNPNLASLVPSADLVFLEDTPQNAEKYQALDRKAVYLSDHSLRCDNIIEPVTVSRIDKLTHLSAFSIAAATILGSFIIGRSIEESLKLARANLENSTLSSTLTLSEMEIIAAATPESLELIAATLMSGKKGILAADESGGSIARKFSERGIEDNFSNRHDYRNIFFTTNDIEDYLNGVILFDETAHDFMDSGESIPDYLISRRIIPGIKVDEGLEPDPTHDGDTLTKGLETLPQRLQDYYEMGLRFAKWRAAFNIDASESNINENCRRLAEYAADCQSAGLVPIVEPELIHDGDYNITRCATITGKILDALIRELHRYQVNLRACIIKVNMILAGKEYAYGSTPEEVGQATAEVLKRHIPEDIAGVVFLSGGQSPEAATANLSAILRNGPYPWKLTFSFARALQDPVIDVWAGDNANLEKARQAFLDRLIANTEIL